MQYVVFSTVQKTLVWYNLGRGFEAPGWVEGMTSAAQNSRETKSMALGS